MNSRIIIAVGEVGIYLARIWDYAVYIATRRRRDACIRIRKLLVIV